jgi:hypothetical protein
VPFHHLFEPRIDHLVGEDIREDGADTPALRHRVIAS